MSENKSGQASGAGFSPPSQGSTPANFDMLVCEQFSGIDTQADRSHIAEAKMAWCDNWMPFGQGQLRPLPSANVSYYNAAANSKTIWSFDFFQIATTNYVIVFHTDGSSVIFTVPGATNSGSQAAGTYRTGGIYHPRVNSWGGTLGLFVSPGGTAGGYVTWDGTNFTNYANPAYAIETFTNRVWLAYGRIISFTAPSSPTDFSTSDGGGTFPSYDGLLRAAYVNLNQSNGNLYLYGDSSVAYIAGVQTSGTPPTTTFTNQNIDPQTGTPWADTVKTFGRALIFANQFGVHALYGGTVEKISTELDGIFADPRTQAAIGSASTYMPSAAVVTLYGVRCYALLFPVFNPVLGALYSTILLWDGKRWFTSTQFPNDSGTSNTGLVWINSIESNSTLTAWGTDGSNLYQLFSNGAGTGKQNPLVYYMQTKLWYEPHSFSGKRAMRIYTTVRNSYYPSGNMQYTIDTGSTTTEPLSLGFPLNINAPLAFYYYDVNEYGSQIGLTVSSTQFVTLVSVSLGIQYYDLYV